MEICEELNFLRSAFINYYNKNFLFAPSFVQERLYVSSLLSSEALTHIELDQFVQKLVKNNDRSYLITGESGGGKTSFGLSLAKAIWNLNLSELIPVYINLPETLTFTNESNVDLLKLFLDQIQCSVNTKQKLIRKQGKLVFILDSFDEINSGPLRSGLVRGIWDQCKREFWTIIPVVITCSRPEATPKYTRQQIFEFVQFGHVADRSFLEFELESFTKETINTFFEKIEAVFLILKTVDSKDIEEWGAWGSLQQTLIQFDYSWDSQVFSDWFNQIPDMYNICGNPYVLTLVCQVLPAIVLNIGQEMEKLKKLCATRVGIYSAFVDQFFSYQAARAERGQIHVDKSSPSYLTLNDWKVYFHSYAQNLASRMISSASKVDSIGEMVLSDVETLDSSLVEPVLSSAQLQKLENVHVDLFPPRLRHWEDTRIVKSGSPAQVHNMKLLRASLSGSLLQVSTNENGRNCYKFMHKSMFEYFAAQEAFESSLAEYDFIISTNLNESQSLYTKTGFGKVLITDKDILAQLIERLSVEYKRILFKLIVVSKENSCLATISANAITILNKAKISFSGMDYSDIQIQGADLRQSICVNTNFRGANLNNVQFRDSYLFGTQFKGASMKETTFQNSLTVVTSSGLTSVVPVKGETADSVFWLTATGDGGITGWNKNLKPTVYVPGHPNCGHLDVRVKSLSNIGFAYWEESTYPIRDGRLRQSETADSEPYKIIICRMVPKLEELGVIIVKKQPARLKSVILKSFIIKPDFHILLTYSNQHLDVFLLPFEQSKFAFSLGCRRSINTFDVAIDPIGRILIATYEIQKSGPNSLVAYSYNEDKLSVICSLEEICTPKGRISKILFNPNGSGLAFYKIESGNRILGFWKNYSDVIFAINPHGTEYMNFVFDPLGLYFAATGKNNILRIWNTENGQIFTEFKLNDSLYTTTFGNNISFSEDSQMVLYGEHQFGIRCTMTLKKIEEDPNPIARNNKMIHHCTVSQNGQLLVLAVFDLRKLKVTVFKFPFQDTLGTSFYLSNDIISLTIGTFGIFTCKSSENKLIFGEPYYWEYMKVVICSISGQILQQLKVPTLKISNISEGHFALNQQCTLLCINYQQQGFRFWNIEETYSGNLELLRNETLEVKANIFEQDQFNSLKFDRMGQILLAVSSDLNVLLVNTVSCTKTIIQVKVNTIERFPLLISVDFSLDFGLLFSCTKTELQVTNLHDSHSVQNVDYNFYRFCKLWFEPNTHWLFSACHDIGKVTIFTRQNTKWKESIEIPLWFNVSDIKFFKTIFDKTGRLQKLIVILLGRSTADCICVEFNVLEFPKDWKILWTINTCTKLCASQCNFENVLYMNSFESEALKSDGATGCVLTNGKYCPFSEWCQGIPGTARPEFMFPFVRSKDDKFKISEDLWVVSLVGNVSKPLKWRAHVYFVLEGVKGQRRFVTKIHLTYSKKLKQVAIKVSPQVLEEGAVLNPTQEFYKFVDLAQVLSAQQFGLDKEKCLQFLKNIQEDMQTNLDYNTLKKNCAVWCEKHLKLVGHTVKFELFTAALIVPRVFKFLHPFSKKHGTDQSTTTGS